MSGPSLVDLANRAGPMADKKKRWIQKAIPASHKGRFAAKAKAAGETTKAFAQEHKDSGGTLGKEATLALTLMGMHKKRTLADTYKRKG
jgi:hypothetical protein